MTEIRVVHGDCLDVLPTLEAGSAAAVVTDPPYGLEFMGKDWDRFGRGEAASHATASSAARGGHSATDGRPTFLGGLNPRCRACGRSQRGGSPCRCEAPDFTDERGPRLRAFQMWCETWADAVLRVLKPGGHLVAFGGTRTYHRLACGIEDAGFEIRDCLAWMYGSGFPKSRNLDGEHEGWGTALKPAYEPIVLARKPLRGTVAANVQQHGTGALNIDGCRIPTGEDLNGGTYSGIDASETSEGWRMANGPREFQQPSGRWPANVVLDPDAADQLDAQTGTLTSGLFTGKRNADKTRNTYGAFKGTDETTTYGDSAGASRFFYCAKPSPSERDGNTHPTVKPVALMRWLIRLVTPPGGLVVDPFAGSGTTGIAAAIEGFPCLLIEREQGYVDVINARLAKPIEPVLFSA